MKTTITVAISILFLAQAWAQELHKCGTPDFRSPWLKEYQQRSNKSAVMNDEVIYVPISLHVVTNNDGTGAVQENMLMGSLCTLNEDFADANIHFYLADDIRYIADSDFYNHETVLDGAYKMFDYNVENTINCYIVGYAAGNCGYNLPYAGMAVAINCFKPTDHTWAHEMGHQLRLPHPFLGWEGGHGHNGPPVGTAESNASFNEPAPEYVTYDYTYFQTELFTDTLIIDTAIVEKIDGSNCHEAADGFCDTAPDYLAFRWECNSNGESVWFQTDPDGTTFRSSGSNIMSYADDACSYEFTPEQILAMRTHIVEEKADYILNQEAPMAIADSTITFQYPVDGISQPFDQIELSWEPVEGADHYWVQVHITQGLNFRVWEGIVSEPNAIAVVDPVYAGREAYWSVAPFSNYEHCTRLQGKANFYLSDVSNTNDEQLTEIQLVPSVTMAGSTVRILKDEILSGEYAIYNTNGKLVANNKLEQNQMAIPIDLLNGLYFVQISTSEGNYSQKIIVQSH